MSAEAPVIKSRRTTKPDERYFLPYQSAWILDKSHLRICEKARQVGLSFADAYDSVRKAAAKGGLDVWVMSRDEVQAKQYIIYCKRWANVLKYAAEDLGEQVFTSDSGQAIKVQVLTFASGAHVYALSSNPDAIVGKTGHVKLDEFALHKDQRQLYAVAKPVIQWGGTLSVISTHRGVGTVFNEIIRDIRERGNPMGWSLHSIPIQKAVEEGIVEKINTATRRDESREAWLARQRAECLDEESWLQEYCCIPADEASAFISYDMISACEAENAWQPLGWVLQRSEAPERQRRFYVGYDVARKKHLSVIDIEELIGDVLWERHRIEMVGVSYSEQRSRLYELLRSPEVRRCCVDATGLGSQLAEEAKAEFGWKVEGVSFTQQTKSELAYPLRAAHEDAKLRYRRDDKLRSDLRGIKKMVTVGGNERFEGESGDSHCDRFWAKALAVCAAESNKVEIGAIVG
jgi:phage FluMu gp28-like protein